MKFGVTKFPNSLADVASVASLVEEMSLPYVRTADSQSLARELYVASGMTAKANAPSSGTGRASGGA